MPFINYTPTPNKLGVLSYADGTEGLSAATTNVSLEQLADAIAYVHARGFVESAIWAEESGMSNVSETSSLYGFNSATYAPSSTPSVLVATLPSVAAGDVIHVDASLKAILPANVDAHIRIGVTHGAGSEYAAPGFWRVQAGASQEVFRLNFSTRIVASASGSTRVRVISRVTGGIGNYNIDGASNLRAMVLRAM